MNPRFQGLLVRGLQVVVAVGTYAESATGGELKLRASAAQVARFAPIEFRIDGLPEYDHPFDPAEVDLHLEITVTGGKTLFLPAFRMQEYEHAALPGGRGGQDWYYPVGMPVWRARFAPMEPGAHRVVAVLMDRAGTNRSAPVAFECMPSAHRGFLRVSRKDARFLEFSDGTPFFPIGQNLAFIGQQQYVTPAKAREIFAKLADNGANYLRVWTGCDDWALGIESRKSAWGRSWDWRPPFVPMPGEEGRKCVLLSDTNAVIEVNPSHPVALRPATRYHLSGRVRTGAGVGLRFEGRADGGGDLVTSLPALEWTGFRREFTTGQADRWLGPLRIRLVGKGAAWLSDLSLKEAAGGPELLWEAEVNRAVRGFYNPLDTFLLDELVTAAEKQGICLQLCLSARDLYMNALQDPASTNYDAAVTAAQNLLRYAVARWGYSTSVAAWEYWNEMNPNLPTDRCYSELGAFLERVDPYSHLRTTSTWGPSAKDCRHPKLDLADVHFYLRPADKGRLADEVDGVLERTRWLRAQAPDKPAHLGEFGLADDQWRLTAEQKQRPELVDVHNALWASALSGASGTALFWWWERLDERNVYAVYRPLARFIADVPWNSGEIEPLTARCSAAELRVVGLRAGEQAWLWVFDPAAAWVHVVTEGRTPPERAGVTVQLGGFPQRGYRVSWRDTHTDRVLGEKTVLATAGELELTVPLFAGDIAARVTLSEAP